jgi:hypothetical protein
VHGPLLESRSGAAELCRTDADCSHGPVSRQNLRVTPRWATGPWLQVTKNPIAGSA